jgi:hypothetical protein
MITKRELYRKREQIENDEVIEEIGDRLLIVSNRLNRKQLIRSEVINKKEKDSKLSEIGSNLVSINHKCSIVEHLPNIR